jgi:hypothetical protein
MSEHVERTIEMVQGQIAQLEQQLLEKKRMVNSLCHLAGKPAVYEVEELAGPTLASIRPDQFYGKTLTDAAREIFERRKRAGLGATAVSEIYDVLVDGGYHFQAKNEANAKRTLYQILGKQPDIFHRLPSGHYGLREWYSNIKETREPNGGQEGEEDEETLDKVKVEGGFDESEPEAPKGSSSPKAGGKEAPNTE